MSKEASVSVSVFSQPSLSNLHLLRPESNSSEDSFFPKRSNQKSEEDVPHAEVLKRFRSGCQCSSEPSQNCFSELDPQFVHRHRLNVGDLSKEEQDMYFMGLIHASIQNPSLTLRKKERTRLKANYVFFGKEICLDAFLYVQNTNRYQVKSLRKHLMTHGLKSRVHGNSGKKPHNAFSLSDYTDVREFLRGYLEKNRLPPTASKNILLPSDLNAKKIHSVYLEHFSSVEQDIKLMSYTTFRRFLQEQFPLLKFEKINVKTVKVDEAL